MTIATATAHEERGNEDFAGIVPGAAVLVDGAGIVGTESICRHGVAWYATRLGGELLGLLSLSPGPSLTALLGEAIRRVTGSHRDTCDVADRSSPSATVAVVRIAGDRADHLLLGDTVIVLDGPGGPVTVDDRREPDLRRPYQARLDAAAPEDRERVLAEVVDGFRAHRNQPGGFWVAKDDPLAADEAITGSRPASDLTRIVLLSNGASRFVDLLGLADWPGMLSELTTSGPDEIIRRVRAAEAREGVTPDDATVIDWQRQP
ncbi:hypothetical protein AB0M20_17300 [Actinoplanes sp. NPDC051633]|uniref:hypothetical protein n=1 Tax=Actinoplanes sp. NPDC051633 TaxID=3155670 RepID=UPI0034248339